MFDPFKDMDKAQQQMNEGVMVNYIQEVLEGVQEGHIDKDRAVEYLVKLVKDEAEKARNKG